MKQKQTVFPPPEQGDGWDSINQHLLSIMFYIVMLEASCVAVTLFKLFFELNVLLLDGSIECIYT